MTMPAIELPGLGDTQKSFDAMRTNLITVNSGLNNAQEDIKDHEGRLVHLEKTVMTGDGDKQLSHAERIRLLEGFTNSLRETIKYWGRLIGGALLLNFLGFSAGIFVAVIKFLPVLERLASQP